MSEINYAKVKLILPRSSRLLGLGAQVMVGDEMLIADYELKSHGIADKPELVLHLPPQSFEIVFEDETEKPEIKDFESSRQDAIDILTQKKLEIEARGVYEVSELPDGHSKAFHGACILISAIKYLQGKPMLYDIYKPILTR